MARYLDIAIVGSGNLAWHLAPALENVGHHVLEIFSRSSKNAKALQKRLYNADLNTDLDFSESEVDVVLICTSDEAIEEVSQELVLPDNAVLAHTSGSQPLSKMGYAATPNIGVFYPLQTFSKPKSIDFADIPILIEAEEKHALQTLQFLARSLSKDVRMVKAKERLAVHVAAVFACNFTNQLFTVAKDILEEYNLDFNILRPLIAETINKSLDIGPEKAQTGPAAREDMEILDKHMAFLEDGEYQQAYQILTELILNR